MTQLDQALMVKVLACGVALNFHKLSGDMPEPLEGKERALFIQLTVSRLRMAKQKWQRYACKLMMDVYTPEWGMEEPQLFSRFNGARYMPGYGAWRDAVLKRDLHQCRACQSKENLHAHHVVPWVQSFELRIDVDNGITLCQDCHKKQHRDMSKQVWQ
jgi:hypothetical protein